MARSAASAAAFAGQFGQLPSSAWEKPGAAIAPSRQAHRAAFADILVKHMRITSILGMGGNENSSAAGYTRWAVPEQGEALLAGEIAHCRISGRVGQARANTCQFGLTC